MAHINNIYKFVNYVDKRHRELTKEYADEIQRDMEKYGRYLYPDHLYVSIDDIEEHFKNTFSKEKIETTLRLAVGEKYLIEHGYIGPDLENAYSIDDRGIFLLDHKWKFPIGKWEMSLKTYSTIATIVVAVLLSSGFTALVILAIEGLIKLL